MLELAKISTGDFIIKTKVAKGLPPINTGVYHINNKRCLIIRYGEKQACLFCKSNEHMRKDCPQLKIKCAKCKKFGHNETACTYAMRVQQEVRDVEMIEGREGQEKSSNYPKASNLISDAEAFEQAQINYVQIQSQQPLSKEVVKTGEKNNNDDVSKLNEHLIAVEIVRTELDKDRQKKGLSPLSQVNIEKNIAISKSNSVPSETNLENSNMVSNACSSYTSTPISTKSKEKRKRSLSLENNSDEENEISKRYGVDGSIDDTLEDIDEDEDIGEENSTILNLANVNEENVIQASEKKNTEEGSTLTSN